MHLSPGNWSWNRWDPWNALWEPLFQHQKTTVSQLTTMHIHSSGLSDIHLNALSHSFPATFPMHSFSLHPTDRILPTYVYSHTMYTKQLQSAFYLCSHRTCQPKHLFHIFYSSQYRKLQMINFKFFCFHVDLNSVLSVFFTTQIADRLKSDSL